MNNSTVVEKIIQLRIDGLGVRTIAKKLNVTEDTVKYHCKKNNLDGVRSNDALKGTPFERFIFGFNNRHGDLFEYISGFINSEKPILIKCKMCTYEFERSAQIARKDKKLTCENCKAILVEQRKADKKNEAIKKETEKENEKLKLQSIQRQERRYKATRQCNECCEVFIADHLNEKYCSEKCRKRKLQRIKKLRERRKHAIKDTGISLRKTIQLNNNICYLCGGECDSNDYTITNEGHFIAGKKYPSIEHVIPLSKGGSHTWDNVKLAHHYCNAIKSDKDIYEESGQIVLMI